MVEYILSTPFFGVGLRIASAILAGHGYPLNFEEKYSNLWVYESGKFELDLETFQELKSISDIRIEVLTLKRNLEDVVKTNLLKQNE